MGALPRPDLPPGPHHDLVEALHELHHRAGWPSLRVLARGVGCSHTTVSSVFSAPRVPAWGLLELLVEVLGGDVPEFRSRWWAATRAGTDVAERSRIAGRRRELEVVRGHLRAGSGRLLLVAGEAGMGKTSVVRAAAADHPVLLAQGSCLPLASAVPLLPFTDALRSVHRSDGGRRLAAALATCPAYVTGSLRRLLPELEAAPGLTRTEPQPGTVAGADDGWGRQRLYGAVAAGLEALAAGSHVVLWLEDLHWADSATLDLLEHLLSRELAVPLVGTWRLADPETPPATVEWCARVRRMATVQTLELGPLRRQEAAEQLDLLGLGGRGELLDRIYRRSEGQPLFTEQLAAQGAQEGSLPRLLGDLLDQRLQGLDGPAWLIARALGIADRPVSEETLGAITGLGRAPLANGLHQLADRYLLPTPVTAEVRVRHPLLAEAIRRRLTSGEAAEEHRRVAIALAGTGDHSAAEVAEHWRRAGEREAELSWRIRAARAAAGRSALVEEAEQWRRVLALWPTGASRVESPPTRLLDVYLAATDALTLVDVEAAAELCRRAQDGVDAAEGTDAADVLQRSAELRGKLGDPEGALELLDRALAIYHAGAPSPAYVRALARRDFLLSGLNRYAEAAAATARATVISGALGDPSLHREMLANQASHDAQAGRLGLAMDRLREAAALRPEEPDPQADVRVAMQHTDILLMTQAPAAAVVEAAHPGLEAAHTWGLETALTSVLRGNTSEALRRAGRVEEAAALVDPVTDTPPTPEHWAEHAERMALDVVRGRETEALQRAEAMSDIYLVDVVNRILLVEDLTVTELWSGRPAAALRRVLRCLEELGTVRDDLADIGGLLVLATRAAADVAGEEAWTPIARHAARARLDRQRSRAPADPFGDHPTIAVRAALAATWAVEGARLVEEVEEASVDRWLHAAARWRELSRPHDAAYCRWRAAEVAVALGRRGAALPLLREAGRESRGHLPLSVAIGSLMAPRVPLASRSG